MYSSYYAAALALRAAKPAYNAHSPYAPSHHCSQQHYDGDGAHRELLPLNPHPSPRFLLDGYLLGHSTHLLLLSARLQPPPPPHPPHNCCHRRAVTCCCSSGGGGGGSSYVQHVPWRLEGRGHRCCGQGAGRSDPGAGCRRLKARGCGCGSYGGGRVGPGTSCGHRDTPRLLGRAVRQEVWEYEGGQWPHTSCSMECHSDWDDEEDEDQCGLAQWELPGESRLRRRWKEEDDDDRCRDCRRRKGVENGYYDEGEYSGQRREIRDSNGIHDRSRYHRRRLEQRGYLDNEDTRRRHDVMEGRDRREFESDEARNVGARRYSEDDRKYDRRRERRDSEYEDVFDARRVRAGRYNEDDRRFDRRTGRMDFEIDSEDDVRRDGRRLRHDDENFVVRNSRRKKYMEEDDQDIAERKHYSRRRSERSASTFREDDSQRASTSRNTADTRLVRENSSSRVRWDDNVDRRAAQTLEERRGHYSSLVGLSNDEKNEYDYDDARIVRVRDSRTGTQDVKVITEDDTRLISSSKNSSILKHCSDVDQQVAARNDETKKSSLKIVESSSEVRGNNTELDSATQSTQLEDRRNYIDNKSSSVQSSVKMASDSRRQIGQHDVVDQQVATLTDSRTNTEKLTDIKMDSSQNVSRATHSRRNYEEVNQMDIDDRSTSVENIAHITRDKRRYVNQQVIHETDIDVQNVTHVDVSTIRASDSSASRSSQNYSENRSDVNSISNMNLIDRARGQQEQIHQNKVIAGDNAIVRGSQSHYDAGVYGQVHSASVIDGTKEMQEQVEPTKARTNNAATTSTSEGHTQTRIYDRFQPSSSVNTVSRVKEQIDLTNIHASDTVVVSNSHNRSNNEARRTSAVNLVEARDSHDESDLQITQGSGIDRSNQVGTTFSESSQDSRERLTRVEEAERLIQHNTVLNSQHAGTSRISDDKDIASLGIKSSEEASIINVDMEQRGIILGRTETTARESTQGGSSARKSVNESVLESAARLEKSSTFHVGQFVSELQRGVSDADTTPTKKNEKSIMEATTRSSSRSRMKGPSDEIWDVQSTTSQETFKTADKEEGSSADGGTNSASRTPKSETAIAKRVHKSLWAYVADIVRLGWVKHGEPHDSTNKSFRKSSSSNSQRSEGWLSSQGHDNDGIQKRNWSNKPNDHSLMKSHSAESESIAASMLKDESSPTGTQGLQISEAGNVPEVGRYKGDFVARITKDDVQTSGERAKQSEVGASPKGNTMGRSAGDSISTLVDVTIGHSPKHEAASSSGMTTQGSAEINSGKGVSAGTSSTTIKAKEAGHSDVAESWRYGPSVAITPYQFPQTQAMVPHENTSSAFLESTELPTGGSARMEEKIVVHKAPEVSRTEEKDAELKRRKIQRNKQVLKETFDEWEEAYEHDAKQRKTDELFMREALLEAQRAADIWEVPVGAVLVHNGEIIARGCNLVEDLRDSTAHAEIVCIREASSKLKTWRLADTTLYVTLEPCAMCAGAILQARVDTVVWGAPNKLLGADGSWVRLFPGDGQTNTLDPANQKQTAGPVHPFHPKIVVRRGVLSTECSEIMQQFFQLRKKKQRAESPPRAHYSGHHHHPIKFFTKMQHMFGTVFCL